MLAIPEIRRFLNNHVLDDGTTLLRPCGHRSSWWRRCCSAAPRTTLWKHSPRSTVRRTLPAGGGLALRDSGLLRLRALVAQARGDDVRLPGLGGALPRDGDIAWLRGKYGAGRGRDVEGGDRCRIRRFHLCFGSRIRRDDVPCRRQSVHGPPKVIGRDPLSRSSMTTAPAPGPLATGAVLTRRDLARLRPHLRRLSLSSSLLRSAPCLMLSETLVTTFLMSLPACVTASRTGRLVRRAGGGRGVEPLSLPAERTHRCARFR